MDEAIGIQQQHTADPLSANSLTEDACWRNPAEADAPSQAAVAFDTYSNRRSLPQHQVTAEFYRSARSELRYDGALYVNHLAGVDSALIRTRAERTLRSVFADCSSWLVAIERAPAGSWGC